MSELRAFLENQKERLQMVRKWSTDHDFVDEACYEAIKEIDRYLERHKPPVEEYEHFRKEEPK